MEIGQKFVARIMVILAFVVASVITLLPSTAVAQSDEMGEIRTPEERDNQQVTLARREPFTRVYTAIIEGVAPDAFESCALLGRNCPTVLSLDATSRPRTLREFRHLQARARGEIVAPGYIAANLLRDGVLSARCVLDETVGAEQEMAWKTVHISQQNLMAHPWDPSRWFSHRCRARSLTVRSGKPFSYRVRLREAERHLIDVATDLSLAVNRADDASMKTATQSLLATVTAPNLMTRDVSADTLLFIARALVTASLHLSHTAALEILPLGRSTVPTGRKEDPESVRNHRLFLLAFITTSLAFILLGWIVAQNELHKRSYRELIASAQRDLKTAKRHASIQVGNAWRQGHEEGEATGSVAQEGLARLSAVGLVLAELVLNKLDEGDPQRIAHVVNGKKDAFIAIQNAFLVFQALLTKSFEQGQASERTAWENRTAEAKVAETACRTAQSPSSHATVARTSRVPSSPGFSTRLSIDTRLVSAYAGVINYVLTLLPADHPNRSAPHHQGIGEVAIAALEGYSKQWERAYADLTRKFEDEMRTNFFYIRGILEFLSSVSGLNGTDAHSLTPTPTAEFGIAPQITETTVSYLRQLLRERVIVLAQHARSLEIEQARSPDLATSKLVDKVLSSLPVDDSRRNILSPPSLRLKWASRVLADKLGDALNEVLAIEAYKDEIQQILQRIEHQLAAEEERCAARDPFLAQLGIPSPQ